MRLRFGRLKHFLVGLHNVRGSQHSADYAGILNNGNTIEFV